MHMLSSEPLEIVEATDSAVRAAKQSRDAIVEAASRLKSRQSGMVRLEDVELPVPVLRAVARMLDELSAGNAVALHTLPTDTDEFTTSEAARLLGMSRPTLISLLDRGELPFRMVGTHRRLAVGDVLAFRRQSERRGAAPAPSREERLRGLEEMAKTTEALGLGY
jgi:excisionase family DNA binding protein